ncbi:hypothetical protein BCV69DRAFT_7197 [Microstroma glucosiphilum]|uniref:FHA domain-containing protein n=1 Tax=Pseudomicrostroma glucosiphilum TaxID=1684307 RepID=A0A316UEN0_9BASI|nr:hypothetical protein BCV69DRAFT_7197 [Pseudomicrostroma glucosiphilum]PWN23672.1 hypothetical protein BCV69DRAFT_7197 [Pseudomicrostroma glucosiphilum]
MFKSIRNSLGLSPTKRPALLSEEGDSPSRTRDDTNNHSEPSIWGRLEVMGKSGKVKSGLNLLERDCTIGRSTDNDVRLCELNVSRHACRIHFLRPGKAQLELLGTNHVTINGSHILPLPDSDEPVSVFLTSGDLIELSKYRFRFSYAAYDTSAASTSQLQSVYVPVSPAEKGRQSLQGLATPDGKRRKVRTSLVRAADVETPSKARETFARLDALDAAPDSQGLTSFSQPRTTLVQLTPRPSLTNLSLDSGSPLQRHMFGSGEPVMLTEDSLKSMEKSLGLISVGQEIAGYGEEDGVQEELVVIDEDDEEDAIEQKGEVESSGAANDAFYARDTPQSPDEVAAKKERRRSSFLGRAWPFSSPQGFYGAERQNEADQDQPSTPERISKEEQEHGEAVAEEEVDDSEEEQEADQSDILSPRLPRSLSSPGRLGSPSFHISSRRKVSLRTKTLLRSSAALVERMAASQSDSFLAVAKSEEQGRPSSPLASREEEVDYEDDEDDEDEVDKSLSLVEEGDEDYGDNEQAEQGEEEHEPAHPVYELPSESQSARDEEPLAVNPAAIASVEDSSNAVSEESEQTQEHQPSIMVPSLSRPTSRSSKRLSMPAFVGRRRSLFGLGIFPRGQTSSEAEDVVGKVDEMFAKAQGSASSVDSAYEASSSGSASPDVGYQSMLTVASCENLKGPAREALRYLLSNKSKATSPAIGSDSGDASQHAAGASTANGGLRSLMLGRQEPMLLQRARTSKRSSLILAPGTPTMEGLRSVSPQGGATPDMAFLRHVFALPKEETDTDPQLRALRYLFAEHESVLSRADETGGEGFFDGEALALLMATPAAQRTLVSAASRVARLTPTESAQQAAAVIEIPTDASSSLVHVQDVASPSQAASMRRGNAQQSPSSLLGGGDDNDVVLGDETPSYKKTRRGCRGGRRRSRNFSPSIDLGAFDVETSLGDVDLPQVIPEEPLSAEPETEAEVQQPEAPAQQSSLTQGPLAPSTPAGSPSKSRAVRVSRQETGTKPLAAAEVLKRNLSSRGRQALTPATTANTRTTARAGKAQFAADSAPGEEENTSTQAEQEVTASPAKPTRARSTRRAADVPAQPQAGDDEEATSARPVRHGARRAESSRPAAEEVASSPVKPVTRKTSTRGAAGRKQRSEAAEEDEVDPQHQLPASEPALPVSTRSRRGAREVAPAPPAAAAAPTPARSTRAQKPKSTTTSTRGRSRHESDNEDDQNDHDDNEDEDDNNQEAERALRRSTRSSPVKKRAPAPAPAAAAKEVQSSPVKPSARTTRRAAAGGAGHRKEPATGDAEPAAATATRTTRRKAAATVLASEQEELPAPVARVTRSGRSTRKA